VGFASGVGQLAIATFLSLFFSVLELVLWKLDLTADHERTFGMLCMPAPGPGHEVPKGMIPIGPSGDASAETPSADTNLLAMGGAAPAPNGKPGKFPELLRVYVTQPEKVRPLVESILDEATKEYRHRKTRANGNNQYLLEYQIRPRKKAPVGDIIERLHEAGGINVIAAESVDREGH
jgi:hypothetical protein